MNSIQSATKDCPRNDCSMTESGRVSTSMGYTPTYDKGGRRTDRGDPNIRSWNIRCSTCGNIWDCTEQYGQTTISLRKS